MQRLEQQLDGLKLREVWEQLPLNLRAIPKLILDSTGIELEVLHKAECRDPVFNIDRATAGFEIDGDQQKVVLWCDPLTATASVIGHELLHLRRDICESQIKLMPTRFCDPAMSNIAYQLENEMEHIFIIPEEIKLFSDAEDRWAKDYADVINRIMSREEPDKTEMVMAWMQIRNSLPNHTDLAKKLGPHIYAQGEMWAQESQSFNDVAKEAKDQNSKKSLLSWMMEAIHTWHPDHKDTVGYGRWKITGAGLSFEPMGIGLLTD
ncbi:hypothetical protein [Pseudomonas sp. XWY-1]|uniref:hypothetical protein n=1 Tax=Pseudomonas sp. XWY-1 TaxID=2069256 RepID=UPI000CF39F88|nr:hypothetical protein [Pseudomonas sp. XWY-1]